MIKMPLEISSATQTPKIHVLYSEIAEIIALINVLADTRHHPVHDEITTLLEQLSGASKSFLLKVAELPFQGFEFFEVLLACQAFNDFDGFVTLISGYEDRQFIEIMTGGGLNKDQIDRLVQDKQALPQWLSDFPWIYRGKASVFEDILYNTQSFKDSLIMLLSEIYPFYKSDIEPELKTGYDKALDSIRKNLDEGSGLSLAEKIMNRKITIDVTVKDIYFLPSFYINPHYLMAYNENARMFLYDMRREDKAADCVKKNLSADLKILSDETRLEILRLLILQPSYGKILADRLGLTTATISHHLDLLKSAHLISENREGNTKYFSANEGAVQSLVERLQDFLYNK